MTEQRVTMDEIGTPVDGYVRESFAREKYPDDERLIEIRRQSFDRWLAKRDAALVKNAVQTMLTAAELFTREGVEIWLNNPNRMFKGRTPMELLSEGSDEPWRLAEALADGAVV